MLLCYLGLLLVPSSQELHDYNVWLGHLQYTVHLLSIINWLVTVVNIGKFKMQTEELQQKIIL